ncbi:MAG: alpha-amylase [Bacteroidetes bacterium]|nr:MAG: alpha-amylase [Bacteroidota bacterium]
MKYRFVFSLLAFLISFAALSQDTLSVYPTHWWVNMKNPKLQLLVRYQNIKSGSKVVMAPYPGVQMLGSHTFENADYVAIDVNIDKSAKPGTLSFRFMKGDKQVNQLKFELKERRKGNGTQYAQGVTSSDFIYLLMPDRFSDGDDSNDRIPGMRDQSLNRDSIFLRHGGDLQGVINHLDYFQQLGITSLWLTPVIENDMPDRTEHGYAFTNHYRIEPRLGGAVAYKKLSDELHKRGMKLIQDAVYNHVGLYHFLKQSPPDATWFHQWPEFTQPNYKDQVHFDPYVAPSDKKQMTDGWFTAQMPDLNQNNPFVAQFLIQHAIWCVEEFGVDGWRIDTYIYVDQEFMNRCNQALIDEYPKITMFGECWVNGTANSAYFARNIFNTPFKSNLIGVTDFQSLFSGIQPSLLYGPGGVNQLYQTASNDFMYKEPMNNVIFLDNHDMSRFYSQMNEGIPKVKMGLEWLLTWRGIPQIYYGTEVLMKGISNPDGWVRLDFPGGWKGDSKNAFTKMGMTPSESEVQELVRTLAHFRKTSSAIKTGKMMQYVPKNGLYVYARYDKQQTVLCVMNTDTVTKQVDFSNYKEVTDGFAKGKNVVSGQVLFLANKREIPPTTMWVLELSK